MGAETLRHRAFVRRPKLHIDRHVGGTDRDGGIPPYQDRPLAAPVGDALVGAVPAVAVVALAGEGSLQRLIILSQVVLSLQLSFAVIPLIHFTSNRRNMGELATPISAQVLAWLTAGVIAALNVWLVLKQVGDWVSAAATSHARFVGVPVSVLLAGVLYGALVAAAGLLLWITLKPWLRPEPAWTPAPSVELDWTVALRPRPLERIALALEHTPNDAEIVKRAMSMAKPSETKLVLLHVVDTPMTRVYGDDTLDRETDADERYLAEVARVLRSHGFDVDLVLLHGPNRAGLLIAELKCAPVDLLVVGSHGHGLVRDLLFGETVDRVRHGLDVPMLIARPGS